MAELLCYGPANIIESTYQHLGSQHYRKQLIPKAPAMIHGGLLQDIAQMKLDVLSAVHFIAEAWRLITLTTIKNCFVKCEFSIDYVSSAYDSAVKLNEDEEDHWHSEIKRDEEQKPQKTSG
jgi:hypothetical protein